ncbi:MAG: hypothetical protein WCO38_10345 [Verrucomicrobiota bacterium]
MMLKPKPITTQNQKTLLVVCTGNLYRSPVATVFIQHRLKQSNLQGLISVVSAGLGAVSGQEVPSEIVNLVWENYGLDLSEHLAQPLTTELFQNADLVLVMEQQQLMRLAQQYPRQTKRLKLISELSGQIYDIPDALTNSSLDIAKTTEQLHALITRNLITLLQWVKLEI